MSDQKREWEEERGAGREMGRQRWERHVETETGEHRADWGSGDTCRQSGGHRGEG